MPAIREPKLSLGSIRDCWSQERGPLQGRDDIMCVLLRALWRGDFEQQDATPTSSDRLAILRIIFSSSRNGDTPVLFLIQGQPEPPLIVAAPDGCSLGDLRLRLPVPSSDPAGWTIAECDQAFKELAAECTPPATTLPWYMSDAVVAPIILGVEVSFVAFQRLIHANRWPMPQFWDPLAEQSSQASATTKRSKPKRAKGALSSRDREIWQRALDLLIDLNKHGAVSAAARKIAKERNEDEGSVRRSLHRGKAASAQE